MSDDEFKLKFEMCLYDLLNRPLVFTKTKSVKSPVRANATDTGIDFFVPDDFEEVTLNHGEDVKIDLGIKVLVPEGESLIFHNKSGVATKKRLDVGACVIDTDYRGVVHAHLFNFSNEPVTISAGDKIVQGVRPIISLGNPVEISQEEYAKYENTDRGEGGFGSTGM